MLPYIITAVVSIIITALIVWFAAALYQKKSANSKIGNAEEKARGIIDEAVKTAEEKKRESMLEIKEESIKAKNDLDKEIKERRNEISRNERRIVQKEENVDKKLEAIEKREAGFAVKEEELKKQKIEISKLNEQRLQELERISGLTSEQAKEYLLKTIEEDVKLDTAKMINPDIKGIEYQKGNLYDYENKKAYILAREKGKCQICGKEAGRQKMSMGLSEFIRLSNIQHDNKYDYSQVD
jgi:ribonuclease Y